MGCRYCGKELALFKRLTRGGEFCSEAHKQSYQDEYNRLALSRLLQAQAKGQTESSAENAAHPLTAPVAVEEPAAPELLSEERAADAPVMESAPLEISSLEESATEEGTEWDASAEPELEPQAEPESESESEPLEIADFLRDSPAIAALPDETPHLEPCLEFSPGPAVADWRFTDDASTLSTAALVSLDLPPNPSPSEHPVASADLTPREFTNGPGQSTVHWKVASMHQLPSAGPVSINVSPNAIDFAADRSIAQAVDFETGVLVEDSDLLELPLTGIEFPTEDSDVVVASRYRAFRQNKEVAIDSSPSQIDPAAPGEDDSPRASLEALSRLHQDLVQQEATPEEPPVQVAEAAPVAEAQPVSEEEPRPGTPTPGRATELLHVAIRMYPPAKPVPVGGVALPTQSEPLLPHLKSLPLRPKVAVASGYVPPATTPAQPKATASAPQTAPQAAPKDSRPTAPSKQGVAKPAPAAKPPARITQPKQQPKQPPAPAKAPETSKPAAKFQPPLKVAVPKTAPPSPAQVGTHAATTDAMEPARSVKPAGEPVPNFGVVQPANSSFAGSLKMKLGIAITLLVAACSTWLGWGNRSQKPAGSNSAISADGSGPSIIMGEGGWVEGWGGDPSGMHSDRQITIYRPSLKLSDYRVEFQGSIETQSIGWVFRAADPDNYYAMKLRTVSSGLSPKVALFKYLVINGRQTQVGRVPIDLTVQADTVFNIRTDVRGPQFSTYIQGRQVDVWTDDQLKAGGVGFLNEREERGKVKSASIRYLNGAAK
jgi:hypothetical protein